MSDSEETKKNHPPDDTDEWFESGEEGQEDASRKNPKKRPIWFGLLIIGISIYFMVTMIGDLTYIFTSDAPEDLGNAIGLSEIDLPDDALVSVRGIRNPARGIRLNAFMGDRNVFQFMGTKNVFVETRVEVDDEEKKKGGGALVEKTYTGRLKRFGNVSYFSTVRKFAAQNFGIAVEESALLVKVDEKPEDLWYVPILFGLLVVIVIFNLALLIKRFKS